MSYTCIVNIKGSENDSHDVAESIYVTLREENVTITYTKSDDIILKNVHDVPAMLEDLEVVRQHFPEGMVGDVEMIE